MLFLVFLILSLAATAVYALLAASVSVWSLLGVFALGWLGANLLFVIGFFAHGLLLPRLAPGEGIEKRRRGCLWFYHNVPLWLCTYAGVKMHAVGLEKMPEGRFLFVCNHRSMFDPLSFLAYLSRYEVGFVSKPSNLELPVIGLTARHAGCIAIDRENNREALKAILLAADYLKRDLCSIGIYPEGTRSRTGELLPFHAGSFKIAQKAGVPLVVACTYGTEKVGRRLFRPTPVYLEILEVIEPERLKSMSTQALAEEAREKIRARLAEVEGAGN